MQPFVEKARSYGFDKAETFDQVGPAIKTIRERGFDPADIVKAFSKQQDDNPNASPDDIIKRMEARMDERLSVKEKEWVVKQAQKEHDKAIGDELAALDSPDADKAVGDELPDSFKAILRDARVGAWFRSRQTYGDDHPLAKSLGGAGREGMESISKSLKENWDKTVTALQAKQAAAIGDAARKRNPTTPAGANGGQGPATKPNPGDPDAKRARLQALADAQLAKKK